MAEQIKVKAKPGKTKKEKDIQFNRMLKRWKSKYLEFGIREELISRKEFLKPSLKKRKQMQEARRENKRMVEFNKRENG